MILKNRHDFIKDSLGNNFMKTAQFELFFVANTIH